MTTSDEQQPSQEQVYLMVRAMFPKSYFYSLAVASVVDDKTIISVYVQPSEVMPK